MYVVYALNFKQILVTASKCNIAIIVHIYGYGLIYSLTFYGLLQLLGFFIQHKWAFKEEKKNLDSEVVQPVQPSSTKAVTENT